MGWSSNPNWRTTKEAIDDESRCNDDCKIEWRSGSSVIYVRKADGKPFHNYFITSKTKDGIWVKCIGDFRAVAAAKKYISLANKFIADHPEEHDPYIDSRIAEAMELVNEDSRKANLKNLKVGDKVYIKDQYVQSGWATYAGRSTWNKHSHLVSFAGGGSLVRVQNKHFDLEKTFPNL